MPGSIVGVLPIAPDFPVTVRHAAPKKASQSSRKGGSQIPMPVRSHGWDLKGSKWRRSGPIRLLARCGGVGELGACADRADFGEIGDPLW